MKIFAYLLSALAGFAIGHFLLHGAAAAFASIAVSYHLYLLILLFMAKQDKRLWLPMGQTILIHAAFLAVVVGLPFLRAQIPFFSLIGLLIPGLAPFETRWLLGGQAQPARIVEELKPVDTASATAEDHREFVAYLRNGHRNFRKPGTTVDDEFRAWLADRAKRRAAAGEMVGVSSGPAEGVN